MILHFPCRVVDTADLSGMYNLAEVKLVMSRGSTMSKGYGTCDIVLEETGTHP